ncbi:MAG: mersacidin/lichenicidin family type 2 lantibiotic, partial [Acidobacteriota bacterium]|nr:mersacidin/lichenicidin family type 2 lantibiotic [Acidobacteriota bacterium]
SLNDEQRAQLPQNPAGVIELADDELRSVAGGDSCRCFCPDESSCG